MHGNARSGIMGAIVNMTLFSLQGEEIKMSLLKHMYGPYPLNRLGVLRSVHERSPGTYVLGNTRSDGQFEVQYVGRADGNIRERISDYVNAGKYREFKFSYARSAEEAFEQECRLYHHHGGPDGFLDNDIHPDHPNEMKLRCPVCGRVKRSRTEAIRWLVRNL